ncbi:hypothetical protein F8M41_016441 [Gigaspora margarita]|uniref:Uncharacterized protein n=1 Tax=Gigaspora margarita TaxID=4874 RepID=A0A8H3ZVA0_GIGMA|nr:hypothetical protein F8M41_016441 [Gigaspora margarita]
MDPYKELKNYIDKLEDQKVTGKDIKTLKHTIFEKIFGNEIFEIPEEDLEKLKNKFGLNNEDLKKFKGKYELSEEELENLKKQEVHDKHKNLISKYEISNDEFMKFKNNKNIPDLAIGAFKQLYGKVENPEFRKLERKNEIKKLENSLKDWKQIKYKAYKRAIICLIISSVAFVISVFLLFSYNSVIKSGITDIISAIYGVGSFSTLVSNLITLRSLYAEQILDNSDDKAKEKDISDDVIQKSIKCHPNSLYQKIDFVGAIQNNVHCLLTFQTILSIIMSVILFITSMITILYWVYGSNQFLTANFVLIGLSTIGVYESTGFVAYINLIIQSQVARMKKKLIKKYKKKKVVHEDMNKGVESGKKRDRVSDFEITTAIMSETGVDLTEIDANKENLKGGWEVKRIHIDDIEMYVITNNIIGGQTFNPAIQLLI